LDFGLHVFCSSNHVAAINAVCESKVKRFLV
jgi:hypothetical protein